MDRSSIAAQKQGKRPSVRESGTLAIGDLVVHRLGFGAMRLTGHGTWGPPPDREQAVRVLRRAVELGVDFIDTADSYGPYVSEELIAEALHPYPAALVIATKAGLVRTGPASGMSPTLRRAPEFHPLGRPEYLRQECEMSLRRLKLDRIELFFLHRIDPRVPADDQFGLLADLRREGKIRHVGLSEVTLAEIEAARRIVPLSAIENLYHLKDRQSGPVLHYCEEHGIAFVPWFPMGGGRLLTNETIERICHEIPATPSQVVLAWLLRRSKAMLVIPGTSSVTHLEENCGAAHVDLSDAQFTALNRLCNEPTAAV